MAVCIPPSMRDTNLEAHLFQSGSTAPNQPGSSSNAFFGLPNPDPNCSYPPSHIKKE